MDGCVPGSGSHKRRGPAVLPMALICNTLLRCSAFVCMVAAQHTQHFIYSQAEGFQRVTLIPDRPLSIPECRLVQYCMHRWGPQLSTCVAFATFQLSTCVAFATTFVAANPTQPSEAPSEQALNRCAPRFVELPSRIVNDQCCTPPRTVRLKLGLARPVARET